MPIFPNGDKVNKNNPYLASCSEKNDDCSLNMGCFFDKADLQVESIDVVQGSRIYIYARCSLGHGICPYCGCESAKVHSRYMRHPKDLPMMGLPVHLHLSMRKFFCLNPKCTHKTFAEQPANEVFWHRRRTRRCEVFVARVALEVSSISASSILGLTGIRMSHSTVRRDLKRMRVPDYGEVKVVGVDDWAMRKGATYGSIIVSMESGHPIDILGDREQSSFREWIEKHGKVEIVSRDRSTDYSAAIRSTGCNILEVADHFHLIMNMGECVTRTILENYSDCRSALRPDDCQKMDAASEHSQTHRSVLFAAVKEAQSKGMSITAAARHLGIARQTVRKYYKYDTLPPRNHSTRNGYHNIDEFVESEFYGGRSKNDIFKLAVNELGFKGSKTPFYDHYKYLWADKNAHQPGISVNANPESMVIKPLMAPKEISNAINKFLRDKNLTEAEWNAMESLKEFEWFDALTSAARSFYDLMRYRDVDGLLKWIKSNEGSCVKRIRTFAKGLKMDIAAVKNCLIIEGISNGIVEGFVNKLKLAKRIMYGRAGIQLLKVKMVMRYVLFN
ncbi:MAG: ISL3 family transposase [Bacteroidales bacterium]|nr:ISL3 family transposase [Bacteroidales bacterium]